MSDKEKENIVSTCVSFDWEDLKKADKIVSERMIDGVRNRSALIAYALHKVFYEVFKDKTNEQRNQC